MPTPRRLGLCGPRSVGVGVPPGLGKSLSMRGGRHRSAGKQRTLKKGLPPLEQVVSKQLQKKLCAAQCLLQRCKHCQLCTRN